jgi:hypothetical protein
MWAETTVRTWSRPCSRHAGKRALVKWARVVVEDGLRRRREWAAWRTASLGVVVVRRRVHEWRGVHHGRVLWGTAAAFARRSVVVDLQVERWHLWDFVVIICCCWV